MGGFFRRLALAIDRDDLGKLPFSDDVKPDSRLLMHRNIRERIAALAPFLTLEKDPYMVVGDDGRLTWMVDAYTTSDSYPYSSHFGLRNASVNYIRNSAKIGVDAYTGATTIYMFDTADPILAAYQKIFPSLFRDAATMPAYFGVMCGTRSCSSSCSPGVWAVPHDQSRSLLQSRRSLDGCDGNRDGKKRPQTTQMMQPNFVLMKLPDDGRRVCRDPSLHSGQPKQSDWMDRRSQRRCALRHLCRIRLPQEPAWLTALSRSKPASIRTRSSPVNSHSGTSKALMYYAAACW